MALTYTNSIDGQTRSYTNANGLKFVVSDVTVGTPTDYSSGLSITATPLGLGSILAIFGTSIRATGGTQRALVPHWDPVTDKLRLYQTGGTSLALTEITTSALVTADIVRVIAIGT